MNPRQILKTHIVCGPDEELLLLPTLHVDIGWFLILLLLQLHISILILSVRKCMVETLSMIPGLLCILLAARTLSSWSMWKLEIILAGRIGLSGNGLHVKTTAIH